MHAVNNRRAGMYLPPVVQRQKDFKYNFNNRNFPERAKIEFRSVTEYYICDGVGVVCGWGGNTVITIHYKRLQLQNKQKVSVFL
jgi:hypothetical protein